MVLHVLVGVGAILLLYPFIGESRRARVKQRWSRKLLGVLGVRLDGDVRNAVPGSLIVANHISWLDIFAINALIPAGFISKAEVRRWPVIGWMAAMNETVFLLRGSRGHARTINAIIAAKLAAGRLIAVFPEGTTTDGTHVLHFHAALLQPALAAGHPVVPLAISYWEAGERSLAPRYDGDVTFGQSITSIAACRGLTVRLRSLPALGGDNADRRAVAHAARAAIIASALPGANTPPETPADPQGEPRSGDCPTDSRNPAPEDLATV